MKTAARLTAFLDQGRQCLRHTLVLGADALLFYLALLLLALCCIAWSGVALVLEPLLPRRRARRLGRRAIMSLFAALFAALNRTRRFTFDFSALDTLRGEKSLIIAANHPALWDAVMIVSRLPDVVCVMKNEVVGNVFLGRGARMAGYICNDSARGTISQAVAQLRAGSHVLLFPEGTRTVRMPVNAFKGGIGIIARHAQASVQTVFIETDTPFLGKGWAMLRKPPMPITCRLRLGQRFAPGTSAAALTKSLEQYFADELGMPAAAPQLVSQELPARPDVLRLCTGMPGAAALSCTPAASAAMAMCTGPAALVPTCNGAGNLAIAHTAPASAEREFSLSDA
ncbi:MAG: lysophospholipid acyltransferase family protein [Janthinobacterium lividum]